MVRLSTTRRSPCSRRRPVSASSLWGISGALFTLLRYAFAVHSSSRRRAFITSCIVSGANVSNSIFCTLVTRLSRARYFCVLRASAYILYSHQYAGIISRRSAATLLFTRANGSGTFISAGKSPFASRVNDAKRLECFTDEHSPGQNPRPATNSPSLARLLWLLPMVAPAAILLCPIMTDAMRNELLWCCSCPGNMRLFRTSQHEMVLLSPIMEFMRRAPYLKLQLLPKMNFTAVHE